MYIFAFLVCKSPSYKVCLKHGLFSTLSKIRSREDVSNNDINVATVLQSLVSHRNIMRTEKLAEGGRISVFQN